MHFMKLENNNCKKASFLLFYPLQAPKFTCEWTMGTFNQSNKRTIKEALRQTHLFGYNQNVAKKVA